MVTNRIITGAHYGMRDWLAQRVTAAVLAIYSIAAGIAWLAGPPLTYARWHELFSQGWMRVATLLFALSLAWHAWVGMRDIFMDYIKHTGGRLFLEVATVLTLVAYVGWTLQILWR